MLEHLDFVIERDVQAPAQPLRREQSMRRLARIQAAQPRHPPFERVREGDSDEVHDRDRRHAELGRRTEEPSWVDPFSVLLSALTSVA